MDEKKIETMAGIVCSEINGDCVGHCNCWYCDKCNKIAKAYYNAGYRKESDTAREILTEIEDLTLLIIYGSNEFEKGYFQAIADMKTAIKDLLKEKYGIGDMKK